MKNSKEHSTIQRVLLKVCAVLCALIMLIKPIGTSAMSPVVPIPPIWLPINPYNTESIVPNAELLNDEQKNILYEIIGAYNHIYLGFGGFVLANPIIGVKQWWREYGETFYNSFVESVVGSPRALIDMVGSATYKASQYDTLQEFEDEISDTSVSNYIEYNPELTFAFRDWYFSRGGVYQWQFDTEPFEYDASYNIVSMSDTQQASYDAYIARFTEPSIRANYSTYYNVRMLNNVSLVPIFSTYKYLFINTDLHKITLVDENGNNLVNNWYDFILVNSNGDYFTRSFEISNLFNVNYNANNYNRVVDVAKAYFNNVFNISQYKIFFEDLVEHVYAGSTWSNRQEIYNIDDLDISADTSTYIDNIGNTGYTDINGLATTLGADIVDIKQGVIDNTLVKTSDGTQAEQLTDSLLKAIDKYMTTPSSGVVIPTGIFAPVKGFMEYMWYMTKPLVVFTRDVISTLTFGAEDGFLNTGPAIFVFGVCAFGLIGGLIVKCLL